MNKKKKILLFIGIILLFLVVLISIFGLIDYIRAEHGKKPVFAFITTTAKFLDDSLQGENALDEYKSGSIYYGIGYNVSLCDENGKNYSFNLGYKQKKSCYEILTCTQNEGSLVVNEDGTVSRDENDKDSYEYSFFDGKLYLVTSIIRRSIPKNETFLITNEEVAGFYNSIPGCVGYVSSQTETSYEIVVSCNMNRMSEEDIDNYLPVRSKDLIGYTKEEIINYHHNDLDCK